MDARETCNRFTVPSRLSVGYRSPGICAIIHLADLKATYGEKNMANVYVEARPKGRPEGSHIEDYVVEDHADHALGTFKTQREAIDWAKRRATPRLSLVSGT